MGHDLATAAVPSWLDKADPDGPELAREVITCKGAVDGLRRALEELRGTLQPVLVNVPQDESQLAQNPMKMPAQAETPIGSELRELWMTLSHLESYTHRIREDLRM